jgi:hypothetical protein
VSEWVYYIDSMYNFYATKYIFNYSCYFSSYMGTFN